VSKNDLNARKDRSDEDQQSGTKLLEGQQGVPESGEYSINQKKKEALVREDRLWEGEILDCPDSVVFSVNAQEFIVSLKNPHVAFLILKEIERAAKKADQLTQRDARQLRDLEVILSNTFPNHSKPANKIQEILFWANGEAEESNEISDRHKDSISLPLSLGQYVLSADHPEQVQRVLKKIEDRIRFNRERLNKNDARLLRELEAGLRLNFPENEELPSKIEEIIFWAEIDVEPEDEVKVAPDADSYFRRIEKESEDENYQEANQLAREAGKKHPEQATRFYAQAFVYAKRSGDPKQLAETVNEIRQAPVARQFKQNTERFVRQWAAEEKQRNRIFQSPKFKELLGAYKILMGQKAYKVEGFEELSEWEVRTAWHEVTGEPVKPLAEFLEEKEPGEIDEIVRKLNETLRKLKSGRKLFVQKNLRILAFNHNFEKVLETAKEARKKGLPIWEEIAHAASVANQNGAHEIARELLKLLEDMPGYEKRQEKIEETIERIKKKEATEKMIEEVIRPEGYQENPPRIRYINEGEFVIPLTKRKAGDPTLIIASNEKDGKEQGDDRNASQVSEESAEPETGLTEADKTREAREMKDLHTTYVKKINQAVSRVPTEAQIDDMKEELRFVKEKYGPKRGKALIELLEKGIDDATHLIQLSENNFEITLPKPSPLFGASLIIPPFDPEGHGIENQVDEMIQQLKNAEKVSDDDIEAVAEFQNQVGEFYGQDHDIVQDAFYRLNQALEQAMEPAKAVSDEELVNDEDQAPTTEHLPQTHQEEQKELDEDEPTPITERLPQTPTKPAPAAQPPASPLAAANVAALMEEEKPEEAATAPETLQTRKYMIQEREFEVPVNHPDGALQALDEIEAHLRDKVLEEGDFRELNEALTDIYNHYSRNPDTASRQIAEKAKQLYEFEAKQNVLLRNLRGLKQNPEQRPQYEAALDELQAYSEGIPPAGTDFIGWKPADFKALITQLEADETADGAPPADAEPVTMPEGKEASGAKIDWLSLALRAAPLAAAAVGAAAMGSRSEGKAAEVSQEAKTEATETPAKETEEADKLLSDHEFLQKVFNLKALQEAGFDISKKKLMKSIRDYLKGVDSNFDLSGNALLSRSAVEKKLKELGHPLLVLADLQKQLPKIQEHGEAAETLSAAIDEGAGKEAEITEAGESAAVSSNEEPAADSSATEPESEPDKDESAEKATDHLKEILEKLKTHRDFETLKRYIMALRSNLGRAAEPDALQNERRTLFGSDDIKAIRKLLEESGNPTLQALSRERVFGPNGQLDDMTILKSLLMDVSGEIKLSRARAELQVDLEEMKDLIAQSRKSEKPDFRPGATERGEESADSSESLLQGMPDEIRSLLASRPAEEIKKVAAAWEVFQGKQSSGDQSVDQRAKRKLDSLLKTAKKNPAALEPGADMVFSEIAELPLKGVQVNTENLFKDQSASYQELRTELRNAILAAPLSGRESKKEREEILKKIDLLFEVLESDPNDFPGNEKFIADFQKAIRNHIKKSLPEVFGLDKAPDSIQALLAAIENLDPLARAEKYSQLEAFLNKFSGFMATYLNLKGEDDEDDNSGGDGGGSAPESGGGGSSDEGGSDESGEHEGDKAKKEVSQPKSLDENARASQFANFVGSLLPNGINYVPGGKNPDPLSLRIQNAVINAVETDADMEALKTFMMKPDAKFLNPETRALAEAHKKAELEAMLNQAERELAALNQEKEAANNALRAMKNTESLERLNQANQAVAAKAVEISNLKDAITLKSDRMVYRSLEQVLTMVNLYAEEQKDNSDYENALEQTNKDLAEIKEDRSRWLARAGLNALTLGLGYLKPGLGATLKSLGQQDDELKKIGPEKMAELATWSINEGSVDNWISSLDKIPEKKRFEVILPRISGYLEYALANNNLVLHHLSPAAIASSRKLAIQLRAATNKYAKSKAEEASGSKTDKMKVYFGVLKRAKEESEKIKRSIINMSTLKRAGMAVGAGALGAGGAAVGVAGALAGAGAGLAGLTKYLAGKAEGNVSKKTLNEIAKRSLLGAGLLGGAAVAGLTGPVGLAALGGLGLVSPEIWKARKDIAQGLYGAGQDYAAAVEKVAPPVINVGARGAALGGLVLGGMAFGMVPFLFRGYRQMMFSTVFS
jgi:hypothetical protein